MTVVESMGARGAEHRRRLKQKKGRTFWRPKNVGDTADILTTRSEGSGRPKAGGAGERPHLAGSLGAKSDVGIGGSGGFARSGSGVLRGDVSRSGGNASAPKGKDDHTEDTISAAEFVLGSQRLG